MHDARVVSGLMGGDVILFLEEGHACALRASQQFSCEGRADDAGSDHGEAGLGAHAVTPSGTIR